jgi:hypothetical protein
MGPRWRSCTTKGLCLVPWLPSERPYLYLSSIVPIAPRLDPPNGYSRSTNDPRDQSQRGWPETRPATNRGYGRSRHPRPSAEEL